jgi:hypothetical protein
MTSQAPPRHHDETTLVVLEQALKDVCQFSRRTTPIVIGKKMRKFSKP